jgi:hypothetical protein
MKKTIVCALALLVAGCATKVTVTGKKYPPISIDEVKVFASIKPNCNLEEIGLVVTNLKWNQEKAVEEAKAKAAELGANYIQISDVKRNIYNDAAVTAVAFRCN